MIVDACDAQNKCFAAIITGKEQVGSVSRLRLHFYQLNDNWDEWVEQSDSNLLRLSEAVRSFNSTGCALQPEDKLISFCITQRRVNDELCSDTKISIGLPYLCNIPNWFTWRQVTHDITN